MDQMWCLPSASAVEVKKTEPSVCVSVYYTDDTISITSTADAGGKNISSGPSYFYLCLISVEILLIDDSSYYDYLLQPLQEYLKDFPKTSLHRNKQREGLIRSRMVGARLAKGDQHL